MRGGEMGGKTGGAQPPLADAQALPSRALTALTTSALAVPGLALPARADTPIEQASAAYAFSYYVEDDLSPGRFSGNGSRERYEVLTHQLELDFPVSPRMDVGIDFLQEKMSGASPWFVQASGNERLQVMSGATIDDTRYDLSADLDYYMEEAKDTFSAGFSKEQDYLSIHGGAGTERSFFEKNTTLSGSFAASYDWIEPNNPNFSQARPSAGEKWAIDLFMGASQILTRASAVQVTANYKHSNGYLGDPYKAIIVGDEILSDLRPDRKNQGSIMVRYRHHFEMSDLFSASAHVDYRFYADDWSITSHTFELGWHQNIGPVTIVPAARYYSQGKADFYDTVLPAPIGAPPRERSSDFRLSPYGAVSWKVKVETALQDILHYRPASRLAGIGFSGGLDLFLSVSYERYLSDGAFALVSVARRDEAPALVDFQIWAVTLSGRF